MKSQKEDCLPQTLRVALVNGKIHMNVTNTGQGELHLYRGQNIGIVDLRSASYFISLRRTHKDTCMRDSFSSMKKNHTIISHSCIQLMTLTTRHHKGIQDLT